MGILAEDAHGISVARALQRLLPREDLLLLCDDAYAPYARRRPDVVARRVGELLGQLRADGAKIIVIASPQAVLDALAAQPPGRRADRPRGADPAGRGGLRRRRGRCRRGRRQRSPRTFGQALRRQRGASAIHLEQWPLDAAAIAARMPALLAAGVGALALTSPALSELRPAIDEAAGGALAVVEAGDVAAQRVQRTLRHAGLLSRRRRPGRLIVISSNPVRSVDLLRA